ncbi:MAG: DUF1501 domain-containing protein [Fuerstiella sp.]|nr:DUF1501 domain-containing protein [Fuerstiella sp.]
MTQERLGDRRTLLQGFDHARRVIDTQGVADAQDSFTHQAFEMVTGDKARAAFDIAAEPDAVRSRYGTSSLGQNILLARRLVESGVKFVSVRVNTLGSWDDHKDVKGRMHAKGPAFDQGVAALITDLHERGLANRVMVVAMGEFGRTPRINKDAGRDHWGRVMSVMLAGGNLNTGQVIGSLRFHRSESGNQAISPRERLGHRLSSSPYRPRNDLQRQLRSSTISSGRA